MDEVFNSCKNKRYLDEKKLPTQVCFIVATTPSNITSTDPIKIGSQPKKHIGFYTGGWIYNYGNTHDAVRKTSLKDFKVHYGLKTTLLLADLP